MLKKLKNKKWLYDFFIINIGLILMSIAYSIFVDPNNLIIGGSVEDTTANITGTSGAIAAIIGAESYVGKSSKIIIFA